MSWNDSVLDDWDVDLECPEYTERQMAVINFLTFWVEGVVSCVIASVGLLGNAVAAYILRK